MLPTASLSVFELLSDPFLLNIPPYQRSYAWGEEQAEQLFDDVFEACNTEASAGGEFGYFLGTILLMDGSGIGEISAKMPAREFDVVDGQQRLVTLMTLIAVLRDFEESAASVLSKRAQAMLQANHGRVFFRKERFRLLLNGRDRELFENNVLPLGATQTEVLKDRGEATSLLKVRNRLRRLVAALSSTERRKLFNHIAHHCYVVTMISKDIDRAHQMFVVLNERGKKLQRNDILKADLLSRLPPDQIAEVGQRWDALSNRLGADFEQMFSHLRSIFGETRPQIVSSIRNIIDRSGGAKRFFDEVLEPIGKAYALVVSSGSGVLPSQMCLTLTYLNRLPLADWAPAAILVLRNWESNPKRAAAILAKVERFAYLLHILSLGTGKRITRSAKIVAALRDGAVSSADDPVFDLDATELERVSHHMKDLHKRSPKICKLLLLRLNDAIAGQMTTTQVNGYTVEHILPQRSKTGSPWRAIFPVPEQRSRYSEQLGNLVLISGPQNEKAKNEPWDVKRNVYREAPAGVPLIPITEQVLPQEVWTAAEIDRRQGELFAVIAEIWSIDLRTGKPLSKEAQQELKASRAPGNSNGDPRSA